MQSRQHLVEDHAQRIDVRPQIDVAAVPLVCSGLMSGSVPLIDPISLRTVPPATSASVIRAQPEVENLHLARVRDGDVRGLQVAVDDAALVRVAHRRQIVMKSRSRSRRSARDGRSPPRCCRTKALSVWPAISSMVKKCCPPSVRPAS